jgi:putative copper export protein
VAGGLVVSAAASLVMALAAGLEAGSVVDYLLGSRNGMLQMARVLVICAGGSLLLVLPHRWAGLLAAATGLAGITLLVGAGHAAAVPGPVALISQVVHVAAVGTWAGGVAGLLLLAVRPGWVSEGPPPALRTAVPRFSALALGAIGLVGATGVYAAWVQTGTLVPLETDYGRTLVIKTAVALVALAIGGLNFLDGGRMRSWLNGFRSRLKVEVAALAAVLFVSALLATTPPVAEAAGVGIEPIPDAFGEVTPNMSMQVAPGRPGVNRVIVTTSAAMSVVDGMELSLDRLDTGTTTRVPLVLEGMEGMDHSGGMGLDTTTASDGTIDWTADSVVLPAGSRWDTSVRVLSAGGTELTRQRFAFSLSDSGVDEGQEPGLFFAILALAGVLAGSGALAIGLGAGGVCLPRCEAFTSRVALVAGGTIAMVLGVLIGFGRLVA